MVTTFPGDGTKSQLLGSPHSHDVDQPWQVVLDEILGMKRHMELLAQGQRKLQASLDNLVTGDTAVYQRQATENDPGVDYDEMSSINGDGQSQQETFQTNHQQDLLRAMATPYGIVAEQSLRHILHVNRAIHPSEQVTSAENKQAQTYIEFLIDSIISSIIVCNAVFVGISLDYQTNHPAWLVTECIFALIFWSELLLKLRFHGCKEWYCGKEGSRCIDSVSNIFDTFVVFADTFQLILLFGNSERGGSVLQAVPISVFRLMRLIRLTRVLRILRNDVFKDLFAMVQGLTCGMSTLGWAMVLFILFIYLVSLICREMLGPSSLDNPYKCTSGDPDTMLYFKTVPRSLYTVFRCSFGDCSTEGGMPLFEHISQKCPEWGVFYSLFTFVVAVGIFNVISAIFVESTMAAASELASEKLQNRLHSPDVWAVNVTKVVKALLFKQAMKKEELSQLELSQLERGMCSEHLISKLLKTEFPTALFDEVLKESDEVKNALSNLDIDPEESHYLSDILDPDNGGTIGMLELVDGLSRLRGGPRRGDIIAVDLMLRSVQLKIDGIWRHMKRSMEQRLKVVQGIHPAVAANAAAAFAGAADDDCSESDIAASTNTFAYHL